MELFKHEHPLKLIDLQPLYPNYEVVYDDDVDDVDEKNEEVLIPKHDFRCTCDGCGLEINYFHRYYYRCDQCIYSLHKFCGSKIPETLSLPSHPHNTLTISQFQSYIQCSICNVDKDWYLDCVQCFFITCLGCVAKEGVKCETIYHPSHRHPLIPIPQQIMAKCYACGKRHKGIFYHCTICDDRSLLHKDCVLLSNKLLIIQHPHPLTLAYSFPIVEQSTKRYPTCRLCDNFFFDYEHHWIYRCEDCQYYAHLGCVTSGKEPKSGMVKNFEDADFPDLLRLPFLDETRNILKCFLFFKQKESSREHDETHEINVPTLHIHPLIQVDTQGTMISSSSVSKTLSSCHDPMKSVQLLCNGCVRPITSMPFYKCAYDHQCNFVLHEWCTRLPCELKHRPFHLPQHTLVLVPHVPRNSLGLFNCDVCGLPCNGFAYSCVKCKSYYIDVNCAFIPKHVTHEAHPNHLLSIVSLRYFDDCDLCNNRNLEHTWSCKDCDFRLHVSCAILPKTIRHKFDKHPMKLSYIPIENHKSDYFCEVCEEELDPTRGFYHCHECDWSIHSACAPLILQCERNTYSRYRVGVYEYVNIKFGGIYKIEDHPHPLMFLQGIESDGECSTLDCGSTLEYKLIFKCLQCKFAVHRKCCKIMNDID